MLTKTIRIQDLIGNKLLDSARNGKPSEEDIAACDALQTKEQYEQSKKGAKMTVELKPHTRRIGRTNSRGKTTV